MKTMKFYILAAALVAAPVFWAPEAGAVSSYACVNNRDQIQFIKARISYRTVRSDGSIEWKRSPWGPAVNSGNTSCIHLGRAPVGYNFYVEMTDAVLFLSKVLSCGNGGKDTGAVKRTSAKQDASPKYVVFEYNTYGECVRKFKWAEHYTDKCGSWCKERKYWTK